MSQVYIFPPGYGAQGGVAGNVGPNGDPIPTESALIAGESDSGDLTPVHVTDTGEVYITATSLPLPTGAATEATLSALNNKVVAVDTDDVTITASALPTGAATEATLSAISAKLPATLGQKASAASLAVVLASDQSSIPVTGPLTDTQLRATPVDISAASLPLPTGAATETTLASIDSKLNTLGQKTSAASAPVVIASDQSTLPISAASLPLPTGAATAAHQVTAQTSLSSIDGKLVTQALNFGASTAGLRTAAIIGNATGAADFNAGNASAQTPRVVIATDQAALTAKAGGKAAIGRARNDYTSVNVTTGAYVQLIASTAAASTEIFIFDSSGQTLVLAFGAAASEVDQIYITPGGTGSLPLAIPSGTRISIKAVSATANAGEISINLLG